MGREPARGEGRGAVERARFLEQVRRARHDLDAVLAPQVLRGLAVELDDDVVVAADDQQGGCADLREAGAARSGRPPRDTTAATRHPGSAAAQSAAAAPVLAPK